MSIITNFSLGYKISSWCTSSESLGVWHRYNSHISVILLSSIYVPLWKYIIIKINAKVNCIGSWKTMSLAGKASSELKQFVKENYM